MVVLATGMVPLTATDPVLQLEYRQGPGLPDLELFQGFADSNFVCFPYETRRTAIYAAGGIRQPMGLTMAMDDGVGAALKAIQAVEHINECMAVHPRAWDETWPDPLMTRCTSCKRCTEECPFGAIDEDEKGTPFTASAAAGAAAPAWGPARSASSTSPTTASTSSAPCSSPWMCPPKTT